MIISPRYLRLVSGSISSKGEERTSVGESTPRYWLFSSWICESSVTTKVKSTLKQRTEAGYDTYYSDTSGDLGNIEDYHAYLTDLAAIFVGMMPILKPGAYLMVILQNCRPADGIMRPLAWDFAREMGTHFLLRQEFIWCQDQKFMGIWGWPTTYVSNVHHHYGLVFQMKNGPPP